MADEAAKAQNEYNRKKLADAAEVAKMSQVDKAGWGFVWTAEHVLKIIKEGCTTASRAPR